MSDMEAKVADIQMKSVHPLEGRSEYVAEQNGLQNPPW